jgi:hypothetical protein
MTAKRTHGPCTCGKNQITGKPWHMGPDLKIRYDHAPNCPSLHTAQQEPDALTRLALLARDLAGDDCEAILALVSEAREKQRKASEALTLERSAVDLLFHSVMAGKDKRTMTDALHTVEHIIEARKP